MVIIHIMYPRSLGYKYVEMKDTVCTLFSSLSQFNAMAHTIHAVPVPVFMNCRYVFDHIKCCIIRFHPEK